MTKEKRATIRQILTVKSVISNIQFNQTMKLRFASSFYDTFFKIFIFMFKISLKAFHSDDYLFSNYILTCHNRTF